MDEGLRGELHGVVEEDDEDLRDDGELKAAAVRKRGEGSDFH